MKQILCRKQEKQINNNLYNYKFNFLNTTA